MFIHKLRAAGPDLDHEAHDGIAMRVGHAFRRADRVALDQAVDDLSATGEGEAVHRMAFN